MARSKNDTWKIEQEQYIIDASKILSHLDDMKIAKTINKHPILQNRTERAVYQHIRYLRNLEWIS